MSAKGNYYVRPYRGSISAYQKLQMIGVDVAKQKLDVSVDDNTALTIDNHEESFKTY